MRAFMLVWRYAKERTREAGRERAKKIGTSEGNREVRKLNQETIRRLRHEVETRR